MTTADAEVRNAIAALLDEKRKDTAFMTRIKESVERNKQILDRLAQDDK